MKFKLFYKINEVKYTFKVQLPTSEAHASCSQCSCITYSSYGSNLLAFIFRAIFELPQTLRTRIMAGKHLYLPPRRRKHARSPTVAGQP